MATMKVFIRVGRGGDGAPAIEAAGEAEGVSLGDSMSVDVDQPYRDFAVAVSFDPPPRIDVDEQKPVAHIDAPPIAVAQTSVAVTPTEEAA